MNLWLVGAFLVFAGVVFQVKKLFFTKPFRALIVLFKTPTRLQPEQLRQAGQKTGIPVIAAHAEDHLVLIFDQTNLVVTEVPHYYGAPKLSIEGTASLVRESRARKAVLEHTSYLTIECLVAPDEETWNRVLCNLGKILAECLDEEATLLWRTDTNATLLLTPTIREKMSAGDLSTAFQYYHGDEVISLHSEDPRLLATIEEAKSRWPEFVEAFHRINDPEKTFVKASLCEGDNVECVWFRVESIGESEVRAQLLSKPLDLKTAKKGDILTVPISNIQDWIYFDGNTEVGQFSSKVL